MKREPVAIERDPDKWLDRLMRRRTASHVTAAAGCLDPGTLAAWADGELRGKELAAAEIHASECSRCLALVAAIQRTAPAVAEHTRSSGALWRWLAPLAAAATAVAIWVVIPEQQRTPVAPESAPIIPTPAPMPSAPIPRPREEAAPPRALPQQAPSARIDALGRQSRDASIDLKLEGRAAGAPEVARSPEPSPTPPPAPSAAPTGAERFEDTAAAARRSMSKLDAIEAVGADPLVRWRVLARTDVERSTDGGRTWVKTASPRAPIVSISDVDADRATVTTADGRTLSTTDGGATWAPAQGKPAAPF